MRTPNKLGPVALRRLYWVSFIGGIIFSVGAVQTLFFTANGRDDLFSYVSFLVPVMWFGFASYCTRRLKYLANKLSEDGKEK